MGTEQILIIEDDPEIQDAKARAQREAVSIDERQHGKSPSNSRCNKKGGLALARLMGEMNLR